MSTHYDALFDQLKEAAALMAEAGQHSEQAAEHSHQSTALQTKALEKLVTVADAAIAANNEKEDLRDTVARLERLVMELVQRKNGT